jgi:hypothetical protein
MNELTELQAWFAAHCDGEWEHGDGIEIHTLDNPGWRVAIGLAETELEDRPFAVVEENYEHETAWVRCWVEDGRFQGAGGPAQLTRILQIFLAWAKRAAAEGSAPAS